MKGQVDDQADQTKLMLYADADNIARVKTADTCVEEQNGSRSDCSETRDICKSLTSVANDGYEAAASFSKSKKTMTRRST